MNTLRRLQNHFQSYVLYGDGGIQSQVIGTPRVSAKVRLDIYAEAYRLRLLEALQTDFPALRVLVGHEEFSKLGRAYIDSHPSHHFSIRYFGRHMSQFLAATLPYRDEPWLAEMAVFEWVLGEVFDAADAAVLTVEQVSAIPAAEWAAMYLCFHPSVRRLSLRWNVPALWQAIDRYETPGTLKENQTPLPWLLWRRELKTYFRSISPEEFWAIEAAQTEKSFGAICGGLCQWIPESEVALHAAGLLRRWVTDGLLVSIDRG